MSGVYHVLLGGQGFLLDPVDGYTVRALPQVVLDPLPGSGGSRRLSTDPFYERVQRQRRFGAGEGVARFDDPARPDGWLSGSGILVDADGSLRLGPAVADSGAGPAFGTGATCFALHGGFLYAGLDGAPGQVWRFDGTSWTLAFATGKPGVRALAGYRQFLYVGNAADGDVQRWDGTSLATAFSTPGVTSVRALCVGTIDGSYLYAGSSIDGGSAFVEQYDGTARVTLATLEEPCVEAVVVLDGRLYVCAGDERGQPRGALYSYAGGGLVAERSFGDGYATAAMGLGGRLVLGWSSGGRVLAWDRAARTLVDLRPPTASAAVVRGLVSLSGALWLAERDAGGMLALRRFEPSARNGAGAWSCAAETPAAGEVLGLAAYGGELFVGLASATGSAPIMRADPRAAGTSGSMESAPFDDDLPELDKAWRAVSLSHAPLPTGATLAVEARAGEGDSWQSLNAVGGQAGSVESTFTPAAALVARSLQLRVTLARGSGPSASPGLREIAVRSVLVPPPRREWTLRLLLEGDATRPLRRLDSTPEPLSGRQLAAALWALRAQPGPLSFVDLEGATHEVWLRDLREAPRRAAPLVPDAPWTIAHATLVEA